MGRPGSRPVLLPFAPKWRFGVGGGDWIEEASGLSVLNILISLMGTVNLACDNNEKPSFLDGQMRGSERDAE